MADRLPPPITVTDQLLVAVIDRLDRLITTLAPPTAPPLPGGAVELRERQQPQPRRNDSKGRR